MQWNTYNFLTPYTYLCSRIFSGYLDVESVSNNLGCENIHRIPCSRIHTTVLHPTHICLTPYTYLCNTYNCLTPYTYLSDTLHISVQYIQLSDTLHISVQSYFFRLSRYQERLKQHIETYPEFVQPTAARNEILQRLEEPLRDLSVSRTSFQWGVPV